MLVDGSSRSCTSCWWTVRAGRARHAGEQFEPVVHVVLLYAVVDVMLTYGLV
jgi:hypothetical protein